MGEKITSLYAEIGADTSKLKQGLADSKRELTGFKDGLNDTVKRVTGLDIASLSAAGAITGIALAAKKAIDHTMQYSFAVDDLSRALGTSAEESSKLIQIADDLRVDIGALKMGFKAALKEGVTPNIEGLKSLAAQYQALPTPVEKSQFAIKYFGRSALELNKILEATPEQLEAMAQSAEDAGLILSSKDVEATKEFYGELDNLKDRLEGVEVTVGKKMIPALIKAADALNVLISAKHQFDKAFEDHSKDVLDTADSYNEYAKEVLRAAAAAKIITQDSYRETAAMLDNGETIQGLIDKNNDWSKGLELVIEKTGLLTEGQYAAYEAETQLGDARQESIQATRDATTANADYAEALGNTAEESEGYRARIRQIGVEFGNVAVASEVARAGMAGWRDAVRGAGKAAEEANPKIQSTIDIASHDVGSPIASFIEDLKWYMAGGGVINTAFENIKKGVESGKLTPEEGLEMLEGAFIAAEDLQAEIDGTDGSKAAQNISDTLGISLEAAKARVDGTDSIQSALNAFTSKSWFVDIYYREHNKPTGVYTGGGSGGGSGNDSGYDPKEVPGGATGLHMVVPPGFPGDTYQVRASSGEKVDITPSGQSSGGDVYVVQNFYDTGAAALGMAYVESLRSKRLDAGMGV